MVSKRSAQRRLGREDGWAVFSPARAPLIGALALLCGAGCAGGLAAKDVRTMAARGEVAPLVELYQTTEQAELRTEVLNAAAARPEDTQFASLLVNAATKARLPSDRALAAESLAEVEHPRAESTLIDALADPHPSVRGAARTAVSRRAPEMQNALRQAARGHPNALVRASSLRALVASVSEASRPATESALTRAAADAAPGVRKAAVMGFGRLKMTSARSLLVGLNRSDPQREVRMAAQSALDQLGGEGGKKAVLAVLPLEVGSPDPKGELRNLADQVAEVARTSLSAHPLCDVVDRRRMAEALAELRKHGTLIYDGDSINAPAIGELKIANQLVYGRISKRGPVYSVVLQRLDVSTMELVGGGSVTLEGYAGELDGLVREVVERFVRRIR